MGAANDTARRLVQEQRLLGEVMANMSEGVYFIRAENAQPPTPPSPVLFPVRGGQILMRWRARLQALIHERLDPQQGEERDG